RSQGVWQYNRNVTETMILLRQGDRGASYRRCSGNVSAYAHFFLLPVTGLPSAPYWNSRTSRIADYRLEGHIVSFAPSDPMTNWFQRRLERS
ncbi:MAG: hypothetical protein AAGC91_01525, partial [Pseudomonadota bacterium]